MAHMGYSWTHMDFRLNPVIKQNNFINGGASGI